MTTPMTPVKGLLLMKKLNLLKGHGNQNYKWKPPEENVISKLRLL